MGEEKQAKEKRVRVTMEDTKVNETMQMCSNPSWFTPSRLLVIFCMINMINYVDRGAIASNGVSGNRRTCDENGKCTDAAGIVGQFDLNNFEDGVLASAFMVGLLVASPIFASLAKSVNPFRLIGVGLLVWTAAVIGCGLSWGFWSIAIFRMLVGVGEASFISLAAPFIDDSAPKSQRTSWLGAFYMCIPVGYAIGYIYGGLVGTHLLWRWAFWLEAIMMFPFVVLGFVMKPLQLKGFTPASSEKASSSAVLTNVSDAQGSDTSAADNSKSVGEGKNDDIAMASQSKEEKHKNQFSRFFIDMKMLLLGKVYVINVLGYIVYNFVVGAYSYWGPKAGYSIYNMANADMIFGGITVGCGLAGTIAGGLALDYMTSTIPNAFKLLAASTFFGAVFCFSAFCFKKEILFLVFFAVGELLIFVTQAPVNYVCLHCVEPSLRPLSMAMSTVFIHLLGDVPSSPLVGVLEDHIHNWRTTALILTSVLFIAAIIWFTGIFLHNPDKFYEEAEHNENDVDDKGHKLRVPEEKMYTA